MQKKSFRETIFKKKEEKSLLILKRGKGALNKFE